LYVVVAMRCSVICARFDVHKVQTLSCVAGMKKCLCSCLRTLESQLFQLKTLICFRNWIVRDKETGQVPTSMARPTVSQFFQEPVIHIPQDALCDVCSGDEETTDHILSGCPFARSFWRRIGWQQESVASATELWKIPRSPSSTSLPAQRIR
jgi:hypothetical protein